MSTCDLEPPQNPSSPQPLDMKASEVPLLSTCTYSGKTKWEPWLNWDLGFGGPGDIQVRMAQVMMCSHKKLKTGYVLNTDIFLKRSSSQIHSGLNGHVLSNSAPP